MVPRRRSNKKERIKNVRNVLKEAHPTTHHPKPKFTYQQGSGSPMVPRSRSYKKERKRTLEMFFFKEKLPTGNLPLINYRLRIGCERGTGRGRGKREDEEGKGKTKKERGIIQKKK